VRRWVVCAALSLAGCGSISLAPDASEPRGAVDGVAVSASPDTAARSSGAPDTGHDASPDIDGAARLADVKSCELYTSPPYCSSCRDSRGVCRCGALPCCDQYCQS
jgi:hypothetical protein